MTRKAQAQAEREQARETLRSIFKPGDTAYTVMRHVSRSGMQREISVVTATIDQETGRAVPNDITYLVAGALGDRTGKSGGVIVPGCGMDMGFHVVYSLSRVLFQDRFTCTGKGCPSNDHHNKPYPPRDGKMQHSDGGYALRHSWL